MGSCGKRESQSPFSFEVSFLWQRIRAFSNEIKGDVKVILQRGQ